MTGTELLFAGLGASHVVAAGLGWFAGHHGVKSTVALLTQDVAALKAKLP